MFVPGKSSETDYIIILFLAEDKVELGMVMIRFFEFRSEHNHYAILKEVVILDRI
jgi:hypothetical protein